MGRHLSSSSTSKINTFLQYAAAVSTGIVFGVVSALSSGLPDKWVAVIVIAVAGIVVALFVKDIRKIILVVLVADIPLGIDIAIRDQEWHQGGPTGYLISLMTIGLIIGFGVWVLGKKPKARFFGATTVPALIYLGTIILSLYQSYNLELSLYGLFLEIQLFLFYVYFANHIDSWNNLRLVIVVVATLLTLESIYIILQYAFGFNINIGFLPNARIAGSAGTSGVRAGGTIGSPNSAAAYLAVNLVLVLGAYATGRLISTKTALPALGLGVMALYITMTRTAWGSFSVMLIILTPWLWRTSIRKTLFPFLIVLGVLTSIFLGPRIVSRLQAATTDKTRPELAFMAYNIIRAYPLGVGENNYDQFMFDKFAHPNWVGHTKYPVHNKYLLTWAELGLHGLIAFILLLLSAVIQAVRQLIKCKQDVHLAILPASLLAAFISYALHMATEGFSSRANMQILWLLLALITAVNPIIEQSLPAKHLTSVSRKKTRIGA